MESCLQFMGSFAVCLVFWAILWEIIDKVPPIDHK